MGLLVFENQAVCSIIYRPLENTARVKGGNFHFLWKGQALVLPWACNQKFLKFTESGRHFGYTINHKHRQTHTGQGYATENEFRLATGVMIKCAWDQTSGLHGQGSMQQLYYTAPNKAHHKRKASLKTKPASSLWLVIGQLQSSGK